MFRTLRFYHSFFKFLSTPSARRATVLHPRGDVLGPISIHALREEGDPDYVVTFRKPGEFLSTPSARRATRLRLSEYETFIFLSTPSARRATCADQHRFDHKGISIHALREEGDT